MTSCARPLHSGSRWTQSVAIHLRPRPQRDQPADCRFGGRGRQRAAASTRRQTRAVARHRRASRPAAGWADRKVSRALSVMSETVLSLVSAAESSFQVLRRFDRRGRFRHFVLAWRSWSEPPNSAIRRGFPSFASGQKSALARASPLPGQQLAPARSLPLWSCAFPSR